LISWFGKQTYIWEKSSFPTKNKSSLLVLLPFGSIICFLLRLCHYFWSNRAMLQFTSVTIFHYVITLHKRVMNTHTIILIISNQLYQFIHSLINCHFLLAYLTHMDTFYEGSSSFPPATVQYLSATQISIPVIRNLKCKFICQCKIQKDL
jgi:hypothetical protein